MFPLYYKPRITSLSNCYPQTNDLIMSNFTFCYYTQDEGRILAISANSEEEDSSFNNVTEISNNEEKSDELIAQESSTGILV